MEGDDHYADHMSKVVEEEEGQPALEQDTQAGVNTEEVEEEVKNQEAVQSDDEWGYLESVGYVQPVEPELDAMQRYLEGSGP